MEFVISQIIPISLKSSLPTGFGSSTIFFLGAWSGTCSVDTDGRVPSSRIIRAGFCGGVSPSIL